MATTGYSIIALTAPTSINTTTDGNQRSSDTISLGNGNSLAIYGTGIGTPTTSLLVRDFGPNGLPIGPEAHIADSLDTSDSDRFANAAVLTNGDIVVTWADINSNNGTPLPSHVHYQIFDPNFVPIDAIQTIATPEPGGTGGQNNPDVAALASGGFVIAFEDNFVTSPPPPAPPVPLVNHIWAQTFFANGTVNGAPNEVDPTANNNELPSVAGLANGTYAVAYDRNTVGGSLMFNGVYNLSGVPVLAATQFDNAGVVTPYTADADAVALPSGGFSVNYVSNSPGPPLNDDITTAFFGANGAFQSKLQDTVSTFNDVQPKGSASPDGYQLVTSTNLGLSAGVFGTLIGPGATILLQAGALDTDPNSNAGFAAPVWLDASHFSMSDTTNGPGGDGNAFGIASGVFDVVRTTSGDSATPLNFSGSGIDNVVNLGSANDTVFGGRGSNYIVGNGGNDVLIGGAGGGLNGSNTIYGLGGNNYLQGGTGSPSDVLVATGSGNDSLYGGSGNNYIVGGTGRNTIVGGGGALQTLYGNGSNGDYIVGGSSPSASNVLVESGTGAAQLWGGSGNDYEVGGNGDDLLVGGAGTNYLFGGAGNDTIYGGSGTNYIYPGPGNDFIWTNPVGTQSTGYIYEGVGTGVDTVADFTPGDGANHDVLVLTAASSELTSFADVQAKAFQNGVYTVLPLSNTDQVYLYNVQPFQLTANDFIFT
jgi:Ca2+-binding RTX toxin-like protein